VTVSQGFVDDATKAFALVVELRDALQKEQMASGASAVTKAALQAQIDALNGLIAIKERKETVYEQLLTLRDQAFAMYDKIIKIQTEMIDRLTAQLNKPQSAWQKFVRVVEKIVVFAAGAAIGRGL
jgi:CHASE3 domain sensor protein